MHDGLKYRGGLLHLFVWLIITPYWLTIELLWLCYPRALDMRPVSFHTPGVHSICLTANSFGRRRIFRRADERRHLGPETVHKF